MSNVSEFEIEKYGIVHTILATSPGHFIIGYCNQLMSSTLDEDPKLVKALISKLLTWYDEGNLEQLLDSKWCYNKDVHLKTYNLLNNYVIELEIQYTKPKKKSLDKNLKLDPHDGLNDLIFKNP